MPQEDKRMRKTDLEEVLFAEHSVDASLQLEEMRQGHTEKLDDIARLATILDRHVDWQRDDFFFTDVFRRIDNTMTDISEVRAAFTETVRELNSIVTFKIGAIDEMKRFCFSLSETLFQSMRDRDARRLA